MSATVGKVFVKDNPFDNLDGVKAPYTNRLPSIVKNGSKLAIVRDVSKLTDLRNRCLANVSAFEMAGGFAESRGDFSVGGEAFPIGVDAQRLNNLRLEAKVGMGFKFLTTVFGLNAIRLLPVNSAFSIDDFTLSPHILSRTIESGDVAYKLVKLKTQLERELRAHKSRLYGDDVELERVSKQYTPRQDAPYEIEVASLTTHSIDKGMLRGVPIDEIRGPAAYTLSENVYLLEYNIRSVFEYSIDEVMSLDMNYEGRQMRFILTAPTEDDVPRAITGFETTSVARRALPTYGDRWTIDSWSGLMVPEFNALRYDNNGNEYTELLFPDSESLFPRAGVTYQVVRNWIDNYRLPSGRYSFLVAHLLSAWSYIADVSVEDILRVLPVLIRAVPLTQTLVEAFPDQKALPTDVSGFLIWWSVVMFYCRVHDGELRPFLSKGAIVNSIFVSGLGPGVLCVAAHVGIFNVATRFRINNRFPPLVVWLKKKNIGLGRLVYHEDPEGKYGVDMRASCRRIGCFTCRSLLNSPTEGTLRIEVLPDKFISVEKDIYDDCRTMFFRVALDILRALSNDGLEWSPSVTPVLCMDNVMFLFGYTGKLNTFKPYVYGVPLQYSSIVPTDTEEYSWSPSHAPSLHLAGNEVLGMLQDGAAKVRVLDE